MTAHAERSHAKWSASATSRRVHCLGSLALESRLPEPPESIHAARGTAAHEVAEKCLREGAEAISFLGTIVKTKEHEIEIDEELINSAQIYVDYVRERLSKYKAETGQDAILMIEQNFDLKTLGTPFDAGGTGDSVIYFPAWRLLEIVDLKNGRGFVSEKGNMQLRSYGVGALLANSHFDIDQVRSTIVQPRVPGRPDRSETLHVADLVAWTAELLTKMKAAKKAEEEYAAAGANSVLLDEWADRWLTPGNCAFCKREGNCPAERKHALQVAAIWFDDFDQPRLGNSALDTSPEALARDLDMIPMLEDWIRARRAYAHAQAENGVEIPGYQLSEKIGNRKWIDEAAAIAALAQQGFDEDQLYTKKPISPAMADKLLGAKRKALIEPFVERPITGTNLVSAEKTSRPPAKTKAETWFDANA